MTSERLSEEKLFEMQEGNPFAICRAQAKKLGWSKKKTERCILELKKKMGVESNEEGIRSFMKFFESNEESVCPICNGRHGS